MAQVPAVCPYVSQPLVLNQRPGSALSLIVGAAAHPVIN